ncbi:MAG: PAS domain-containing sensor histidine kinase [Flavobacterium sp.]|nr:MAG: PAS domain-containing sensor histidine kinase [Flavobacterium sp.]
MVDEVSDYAIFLLDVDGTILTWNPGVERIKGYTADEVKGRKFNIFYTPEDLEKGLPRRLLSEAAEKGRTQHEGWRIKKDGSRFWGSVVITALHDDDGNVIGFSKLTRDLTERKVNEEKQIRTTSELLRINEKLRISEERYHRMIAEVEDYAIILLDSEGNIMNWNKGAEKIKGYRDYEVIGKNFNIFYLPEDRENNLPQKLLAEATVKNKATHEGWRVRKDGSRFWGNIVITALHDDTGNIIGFSKVTRDLTARKEAEDLIVYQNQQLQEYAYVASHDLQEPLRKISIFSDLLERNMDNSNSIKKYLGKINDSTSRMTKLIKAVLQYSQTVDEDQLRERVDLNEILHDLKEDYDLLLNDRKGELIVENLPIIRGIPIQMHQLFSNLVGNAIKFSDKTPVIKISADEAPENHDFIRIRVSDNGIGFNPDYADRIFRMFHRLHESKSGTGIGLALCKRIVENHGGSITASSVQGEGATFEILLPKEIVL